MKSFDRQLPWYQQSISKKSWILRRSFQLFVCFAIIALSASYDVFAANFGPYVVLRTLPNPFIGNAPSGLAYSGSALYAVGSRGVVQKMDPQTGQSLGSWTIPGLTPESGSDDRLTGLAWDGSQFWLASYGTQGNDNIRGLILTGGNSKATINITYPLPDESSPPNWPMDLVYADGMLVYPQYMGSLRRFNQTSGQMSGALSSPSEIVYGLTYDGQNLLAGDAFSGTIWRISNQTGIVLDAWQTGISSITSLAYDQSSQTLFIGTANAGIIVAQAPEPESTVICGMGIILLRLLRAAKNSRQD